MLKRFFTTSFFVSSSRLLTTGTNLAVIFFISRFKGTGPLGVYGICFALMYLVYVITSFNMEMYLGKEVAVSKGDPRLLGELFGNTLVVARTGVVMMLVIWGGAILVYGNVSTTLLGLAAGCGFLLGLDLNMSGFLLGMEKTWVETAVNVAAALIVLVPLFLSPQRIGLVGIFLLRGCALLLGIAVKLLVLRPELHYRRGKPQRGWFQEVRFFWFDHISGYFMRQADVLLLSLFVDLDELGAYFLTMRIFLAVTILAEVVSRAAIPFLSRTFHGVENIRVGELLQRLLAASLLVGVVLGIGLALGGASIIALFHPARGEEALWLRWLSLAVPLRMGRSIMVAFLSSSRYQKSRFFVSLLNSVVFILLTLTLVVFFRTTGVLTARLLGELQAFLLLAAVVFFRLPESAELRRIKSGSR